MKFKFIQTIILSLFTVITYAQEMIIVKNDSLKSDFSKSINSIQSATDKIEFKNETGNSILTITDEGGNAGSIIIPQSTPGSTISKLYNEGGTLKFNGTSLSGSSGATEISNLSDAQFDGSSLFLGNGAGGTTDDGGNRNTTVGINTLNSNTSGFANTAIGQSALGLNTTGESNTANGYIALYSNTTGTANTAVGSQALQLNTTGIGNIALGFEAGKSEVGSNKLYIENSSSASPLIWGDFTDGSEQVKINGDFHVTGNVTGVEINDLTDAKSDGNTVAASVFLGPGAGENDDAGASDGIKNRNTAVGYRALKSNTTGYGNLANGYSALKSNTTGYLNTSNGYNALELNTEGFHNTANGVYSLNSNTTGETNTATGSNSLRNNTIGNNNTASGMRTLMNNTTGNNNTGVGTDALFSNITGSGNVALGFEAGKSELGSDKLYIENSGASSPLIWGDFANDIASVNGKFGVNTQSPTARVDVVASSGEDPFRVAIGGATKFKVHQNGGTSIGLNAGGTPADGLYVHGDIINQGEVLHTSDKRFKTDIEPIQNTLEMIQNINGVYYNWKKEEFPEKYFTGNNQIGLIAQEVEGVFPQLVNTDSEGFKSVNYSKLTAVLVEAIKEQDEKIKTLEEDNEKLKKQFVKNESLEKKVEILEFAINKLIMEQPQSKISTK